MWPLRILVAGMSKASGVELRRCRTSSLPQAAPAPEVDGVHGLGLLQGAQIGHRFRGRGRTGKNASSRATVLSEARKVWRTMAITVTSETGRLREAIVHRPGLELVRMTPSTLEYFLFDDVLYEKTARQEHDWLVDLLQNHLGVKVYYFDRMLAEALALAPPAERSALISTVCRMEAGIPPVEQRVGQLEVMVRWSQAHGWPQYPQDPEGQPAAAAPGTLPGTLAAMLAHKSVTRPLMEDEADAFDYLQRRLEAWCDEGDFTGLSKDLIEGIETRVAGSSPSERPGPAQAANGTNHTPGYSVGESDPQALRHFAGGLLFNLTPLPNMMFIRDVGTVIADRLLISRMAAPARSREPLLLDFVQRNHPRLKDARRWMWADASPSDPGWPFAASPRLHLEGGSVLQLREDLVVLGVNQRTSLEAAQRLADTWRESAARQGKRLIIYLLRMPVGFNHLDSVFGVINTDECVVYPPVFQSYGPASVDVVRAELSSNPLRPTRASDFFESLRKDGLDFDVIPCGGNDPLDQQREQWFSATSMLALAPGKVIMYRSAERTAAELARHGYDIIDINDVQTGAVKLDLDAPGKWALKIKGSELSRGHGGPHSLVLPLVRTDYRK